MTNFQRVSRDSLSAFLNERIGSEVLLWTPDESPPLERFLASRPSTSLDEVDSLRVLIEQVDQSSDPLALSLSDGHTFFVTRVPSVDEEEFFAMTCIQGGESITSALLKNVLEGWLLTGQVAASQSALEESAMQLAQSFEEQNWLRGFARNASSFTKFSSPNDVAVGILQPLGYLLRAQDVYLLVHPEETERSGLTSAKFGQSGFSIQTIVKVLESQNVNLDSPPLVRNHMGLETEDGELSSIVCVAIGGSEQQLGYLVAVNRCADTHAAGLPVYDPEFGSGEVGILEEASVLLATQAKNMHLLVQSNQLFLGTLHAMSSAIDARDKYTQGHSERVARLSFDLAQILGLGNEACQEIYLAGILHDIGKIGVPDAVLLKNGPLTDEEFAVIKTHPEIGHRIVERLGHLQFVLPGVLYHHERWDGRGYPHGLAGLSIPLMARIMAVADSFDAMTSSRPYRSAMPISKARSIINAGAGEQWDAEIVACFEKWINDICPSGQCPTESTSIIPQDAPMEQMVQAAMALIQ